MYLSRESGSRGRSGDGSIYAVSANRRLLSPPSGASAALFLAGPPGVPLRIFVARAPRLESDRVLPLPRSQPRTLRAGGPPGPRGAPPMGKGVGGTPLSRDRVRVPRGGDGALDHVQPERERRRRARTLRARRRRELGLDDRRDPGPHRPQYRTADPLAGPRAPRDPRAAFPPPVPNGRRGRDLRRGHRPSRAHLALLSRRRRVAARRGGGGPRSGRAGLPAAPRPAQPDLRATALGSVGVLHAGP